MAKLPTPFSTIKCLLSWFDKSPTWEQARDIWLWCHDNGEPVPVHVEEFFLNKLRGDNEAWEERQSERNYQQSSNCDTNLMIEEMREYDNLTFSEIAEQFNKHLPDAVHSEDSIKRRYYRFKKGR